MPRLPRSGRWVVDGTEYDPHIVTMTEHPTHKERTRARILDEAATVMRERGIDGIGVAALMKRAGLTHGGFYAHFKDRDDLVAHAIDRMFQDSATMLDRHLTPEDAMHGLTALIDFYLADRSIGAIGKHCPLPSLSGEATRLPIAARQRFASGIEHFHKALESALGRIGRRDAGVLASSVLAELVGAMSLARAVGDPATASAMLAASRDALKSRLGLETST